MKSNLWSRVNNNMNMFEGPNFQDCWNKRYNNAYGDYQGGYPPPRAPLDRRIWPEPILYPRFPPPQMMGRGPPFKRFVNEDFAVQHLMRCGIPKDSVQNLPKDLLELFSPNSCGLCVQSFDSFRSSRMHYGSKFHMKCQRRWLSQFGGDQAMPPEMAPLKPRNRYCEICDVEITSTQHADSHYSGRSHRAIVEKRKPPKNTILRQKHMEDRLAQLLRREKKYLKGIMENHATEAKVLIADPKKDKAPGDLFCDICKKSVSSTEQMLLHMNGKRHLSKEKQHIFKMMKGEEGQKEQAANDETCKEETVLSQECEEKKEGAQEDHDWGHGSAAWDDVDLKEAQPSKDTV